MPKCRGKDITEATIEQLQKWLTDGAFSARDLTSCYLSRIEKLNKRLCAVIEVNPDALTIAEERDRERANGQYQGILHGIPFLVKDNIATKDKMQTTAGSSMLIGTEVPADAHVVYLLRKKGAVLLGHTNMSEWASMRSTYYAEGYSSRGGQSRNPYNLAEHAGGSSSGSAISVATNMCAFSLGTETDLSVILPADRCGVVGIKPTPGLTSCEGVIPESHNLDTVGTFGRTVADAAIALDGIYQGSKSFALHLADIEALKGARFGTPWLRIWKKAASDETSRIQYDALQGLLQRVKDAGAEIHPVNLPSIKEVVPQNGSWDWDYPSSRGHPERSEFTVVKVDFYNDLKKYLSNLITNPNNIRGLEDVIAYNINHTEREGGVAGTHPAWPTGQDSFDKSFRSAGIEDNIYHSALEYIRRKTREEGFDKALFVNGKELDGLLVPVQADGGVALQLAAQAGE
ncbi:amidase signature domain-containing protein [Truncatella angustata]|uniref:Amidase signature domain-containing protein n=1 Tax=Truncatella angustata TaxID=152316 RepID=A0A9P9A4Z9_9PEZI|nr:amidase signature domain-containing protein [Truncatella angustata]KAH6660394.1 amidase signature domain-containing protein [Truncatella angustata]